MQKHNDKIAVLASPLPFSQKTIPSFAPVGATLEQIVIGVLPPRLVGANLGALVEINGHTIRRKHWRRVKPKPGTVVNVNVVPMGGGGGKNILGTVLTIAVLVAAPYAGSAALSALAPMGAGITTTSAVIGGITVTSGAIGGLLGAVGLLIVNALAPPPKPSTLGNANNPVESPTQFIEGASNQLLQWGRVPVVLGTRRMFPPQAAKPFTETQGNDQFVRQQFTFGYGDEVSLAEEKIGDTLLSNYTDFQTAYKLEGNLHEGTSLYSDDVDQVDYSVLLTFADSFTTRTTHADVDEAIVDLTFPQGLNRLDNKGKRQSQSVVVTLEYRETGTSGAWIATAGYNVTASQQEALRVSLQVIFPSNGQYDIRLKRTTADATSDLVFDEVYLTSIKSVTHVNPVNLQGINGLAVRIKGTDQLNGGIDQYNAIVTNKIKSYDEDSETWVDTTATSNPADIYRYVLQGGPNAVPLGDDEIDLAALEDWHEHCTAQGYTYDKVIDYDTSVQELLSDIASAGSASPAIVDGLRSIAIDRPGKDVVQIVTPRNSWGYSGEIVFTDLPHGFRVQFPNKDAGYQMDERIVYDDGYNETNATKFEVLELAHCTSADLAFKTGRRHIATARLRPETHTFYMDIESLHFLRGDRIVLEHDVPVVGVGDARVKSVTMNADSPSLVESITIDDTVTIPLDGVDYYARVRLGDGSFLYKKLITEVGPTKTLTFEGPFARPFTSDSPAIELLNQGDLLIVVEAGGELDLVVTKIEPQEDFSARITAVNYAEEIFDAENSSIPPFTSGLTTPLEFIKPVAPILLSTQSDESVMIISSDGSYISRAIFNLDNKNRGDVVVKVKVRKSGDTVYTTANILEDSPSRVVVTGLQDGERYDLAIYYQRVGSSKMSDPLLINNFLFVGASEDPDDVETFKVSVVDNMLIFEWNKCANLDFDYATMKFSAVYSGAAWNTSLIIKEKIYENRLVTPFIGGTYLLKFVDRLGNDSENAIAVITYDPSGVKNVVQQYQEAPDFLGAKDNTGVFGTSLILQDSELLEGYYYFENTLDLGDVFENFVSGAIEAHGGFFEDFYDVDDVFDEDDIFNPVPANDVFTMDDVFAIGDIFGIGTDSWSVELQFRITNGDPNNSPDDATWTAWAALEAGKVTFRAIQFRLKLISLDARVTPFVTSALVTIDMPDRIERGNDLVCDDTLGATITYPAAFKAIPATVITIQDGDAADEVQFISKDATGFSFKVWNTTAAAFVERTYDYISSGYGRVV